MNWNEMENLLSLEGLRPPLSRDSSTYTHAMSYFSWLFTRWRCVRCWCMTLLTGVLLVFVAHLSLPGDTGGHSPWCCWCLLRVAIHCGSLLSWSSVLLPLSWRRRPIWLQVCRGVSVPGGGTTLWIDMPIWCSAVLQHDLPISILVWRHVVPRYQVWLFTGSWCWVLCLLGRVLNFPLHFSLAYL